MTIMLTTLTTHNNDFGRFTLEPDSHQEANTGIVRVIVNK